MNESQPSEAAKAAAEEIAVKAYRMVSIPEFPISQAYRSARILEAAAIIQAALAAHGTALQSRLEAIEKERDEARERWRFYFDILSETVEHVGRNVVCMYPNCGCDGARCCDAINGPSKRSLEQNIEGKVNIAAAFDWQDVGGPDGEFIAAILTERDAALAQLAQAQTAIVAKDAAINDLFAMMDEGLLVRETKDDGQPDWGRRSMLLILRLKTAMAALATEQPAPVTPDKPRTLTEDEKAVADPNRTVQESAEHNARLPE